MKIPTPPWYNAAEGWLLKEGKPVILAVLLVFLLITLWFLIQVWRGKSLIPATAWLTYMAMP
jgi:hypothetical protein